MHSAHEKDQELVRRCLEGSRSAWQEFIECHSALVYYAIRTVLRSRSIDVTSEQIADLHNDVFVSLMDRQGRKLRQYEGKNGCSVSSWVRVIAVRQTIDFLRRQRDMLSLSDEATQGAVERSIRADGCVEDVLIVQEQQARLAALFEELSPRDRLFIKLLYYEGRTPREIGRLLNSTPNAVYSRGNYLREKLRNIIERKKYKIER